MLRLVAVLGLGVVVWAHTDQIMTTSVSPCLNQAPLPINTYVDGCPTPPCGLPQLTYAVINIVFRSPDLISSLGARTIAYMGPLPIPYPLGELANACRSLTNSRCPVQKGEILKYTLAMRMEEFFPVGTSVNLEFSLMDNDRNQAVACIRLGVRIEPPLLLQTDSSHNQTLFTTYI